MKASRATAMTAVLALSLAGSITRGAKRCRSPERRDDEDVVRAHRTPRRPPPWSTSIPSAWCASRSTRSGRCSAAGCRATGWSNRSAPVRSCAADGLILTNHHNIEGAHRDPRGDRRPPRVAGDGPARRRPSRPRRAQDRRQGLSVCRRSGSTTPPIRRSAIWCWRWATRSASARR